MDPPFLFVQYTIPLVSATETSLQTFLRYGPRWPSAFHTCSIPDKYGILVVEFERIRQVKAMRKDGTRVKNANPIYTVMPYILKYRYDAMNMIGRL